ILIIGRMDRAAIDRIVETLLAALEREEECDAASLTFLLRAYRANGRDDVRTALEAALARAIARGAPAGDVEQRAAWLMLFSEATRLSDDERLHAVVTGLVSSLREEWGHATAVDTGVLAVEACLTCCDLPDVRACVADAVDELERIVA